MKSIFYTDWGQLPGSADALFDQAAKDNVFFSRPWFEGLAATAMEDGHSLVLACVVDGAKVMAILPLMRSTGNEGTLYALGHGYTPLYSLLLADDDQVRVLSCMVEALSQVPINGLLLEPVANDDRKLRSLQKSLQSAGYRCEYLFRHYNWIYRLRGKSYEEYMAERPAKLRNTISRKQRKLEREHDYEIRLFVGDEAPGAMADYTAVFNASWKQNEFRNVAFMNRIVEEFSREGWSRLAILYVQGRPVAAQLWFVHHRKASIFRLAYDQAWKQYSPGSILTSFLMKYVIDADKVEEIDFLSGNDTYKQDWMSERRERLLLSCVKSVGPASKIGFIESLLRAIKRPK